MRRPIRGDAADEIRHCRWHLRSVEYDWLRNQPAYWCPNTQLGAVAGCSDTVGLGWKMQQPGVPAHCLHPPQTVLYSVDDRGCDPLVSTHTMEEGVEVGVEVSPADRGFGGGGGGGG